MSSWFSCLEVFVRQFGRYTELIENTSTGIRKRHIPFVKRIHSLLYHIIQIFQRWICNKSIVNCVPMQFWNYIKIPYLFDFIDFESQFLSSLQFRDGKLFIHRYSIIMNNKFVTLKLFSRYNFYLLLLATKRVQILTLCRVNYGFVNQNNCLFPLSSLYLCNLLFFRRGLCTIQNVNELSKE